MRVAFASPLPPMTSGIADYSADLVPRLAAEGLELTLFYEGSVPPGELGAEFDCRPVRELRAAAGAFDVALYQMGNSAAHHAAIHRALMEIPGVVALHEFQLHHLVRELTLVAGDGAGYVEEMRYSAGESGRRAAQRLLDTHFPVDLWAYPLFERVVDRSLAVAVHSDFARQRILASRPGAWVERIPFPVEVESLRPPSAEERAAARAELGFGPDELVIGSFGFVTPHKRLEIVLRAFAKLREEQPDARFLVCGEISPHYDFAAHLREAGERGVTVTGRIPLERFDRALAAVDLAVNLRYPTGGETSASLMRLLGRGVPTIVSDHGSFAEIDDGAVAKVPIGELEEELLGALFLRAARDLELFAVIGRAGRRFVLREHAPEASARAWRELLERVAERRPAVEAAVPPLAPWPADDPRLALISALGADLADLGFADGDAVTLGAVASALAELDWAPHAAATGTERRR